MPETGQCVACLGDSDCDGQYAYCSLALHRCVECTDDQQCGTGRVCEPISHRCATSCRYSDDCGDDDHACDDGHCVVCDRDPECDESNARLCAAGGLACVNCRVDMECAVGRCDSLRGECVQCLTSADCETGLCNPVTLVCVGP